jgi:type IV secretion system protein VirB6
LLQRLDLMDQALARLALLGPGIPTVGQQVQVEPPPWAGFNAFALGGARILFLLTAIAGMGAVRIVTGLMLSLGPFFIAFLMFDSTRGLFEGWVRVLAGSAIAAIGVAIVLGLELALMEPWVSNVLARRMAGEALPTVPTELFVVTILFAVIVIVAISGCARVARAFRLSPIMQLLPVPKESSPNKNRMKSTDQKDRSNRIETQRSRAAAIASVLVATNRREASRTASDESRTPIAPSRAALIGAAGNAASQTTTPVGRSFARRPGARISAGAKRRDAGHE